MISLKGAKTVDRRNATHSQEYERSQQLSIVQLVVILASTSRNENRAIRRKSTRGD